MDDVIHPASVTVVIPTIAPRRDLLNRAVASVLDQDHPHVDVLIVPDRHHEGASATRNRGLASVTTEWVAFLDDDDELMPHHVRHLLSACREHAADVAWGWYDVVGGGDPFPHYRGRQYDPAQPHVVPITYLARADLALAALAATGGFQFDGSAGGSWDVQDMPLLNAMYELSGGRFWASEVTTWLWHHHGRNTSGLASRW